MIRTHRALPRRALTSPRRGTRIFEAQRIFEDLVQAGPPDFTFRALSRGPLEAPSVCRSAAPWGSGSVTLTSLSWAFRLERAMPISHGALEGADTNRAWGSGHPVVPAAGPRTLETGGADLLPGKSPEAWLGRGLAQNPSPTMGLPPAMIAKTQDPGLPQPTLVPSVLMRAPLHLSSLWEGLCTRSCQGSDLKASWM